jgi:hypothetical protein
VVAPAASEMRLARDKSCVLKMGRMAQTSGPNRTWANKYHEPESPGARARLATASSSESEQPRKKGDGMVIHIALTQLRRAISCSRCSIFAFGMRRLLAPGIQSESVTPVWRHLVEAVARLH